MSSTFQDRKQIAAELQSSLSDAKLLVITTQNGLTVSEANELRRKMRDSGATFQVIKKTILCKALEGTSFDSDHIKDAIKKSDKPLAIAYSADEVSAAKAAFEFSKKNDKLQLQAGAHAGVFYNQQEISALATLPSLDELRAKLLCVINAPATKLAILLKEPASRVARVIDAKSKQ